MSIRNEILKLTAFTGFESKACYAMAEEAARIAEKYVGEIDEGTFEQAARPLIKYINENHHIHVTAIVDSDHAEILEGINVFSTKDYIK